MGSSLHIFPFNIFRDIKDYELFTQVQVKTGVGDEYFVADMIFVKKKQTKTVQGIEVEVLDYDNAIVLETKLSSGTDLTIPQKNALTKVKSGSNAFDVRSISRQGNSGNLSLGNSNNLTVTNFIEVWSDGRGGVINDDIFDFRNIDKARLR